MCLQSITSRSVRFPAYGMAPRTVDPGNDVAAISGTQVMLKITPTMKAAGGRSSWTTTKRSR